MYNRHTDPGIRLVMGVHAGLFCPAGARAYPVRPCADAKWCFWARRSELGAKLSNKQNSTRVLLKLKPCTYFALLNDSNTLQVNRVMTSSIRSNPFARVDAPKKRSGPKQAWDTWLYVSPITSPRHLSLAKS